MATEYSGGGDPKRVMALLWGTDTRRRRGPKPRLTVEEIARTAVRIADGEGLAALSMRRLADLLGVTAMSLYTYVPGKAELIDVMVDAVLGEAATDQSQPAGWRPRLETAARRSRALYLRHPWMLRVATARPPMGPNLVKKYDLELQAVAGTGLTDLEMDLVVTLVADYVYGAARSAVEGSLVQRRSGLSDEEWWAAYAPLLEKVFDPEQYPTAARVGVAVGEEYGAISDPDRAFEFGLQRLLDGIGALIDSRSR
jgi:AcrR family transcriptional regulator